jgi:hypothetical protein
MGCLAYEGRGASAEIKRPFWRIIDWEAGLLGVVFDKRMDHFFAS